METKNLKEFDSLFGLFSNIEKKLFNTSNMLSIETDKTILYERLNDVKLDIMNGLNNYECNDYNTREFVNSTICKVIETFTFINKARRSNSDFDIFESLILDLFCFTMDKRMSITMECFDNYDLGYMNNMQHLSNMELDVMLSEHNSIMEGFENKPFNNEFEIKNQCILEGIGSKAVSALLSMKKAFSDKHGKIVERDAKWLKENGKTIKSMNFDDIEIEVPSDNKVSFANLINKHDIFDKNFKDSDNETYEEVHAKIKRFEDKNENLKNGLDNYFRTGNSRREVGLRKINGGEAKSVVSSMIDYCNDFIAGKKYIDDKLANITEEANANVSDDETVKESVSILERLILFEANEDEELDDIDLEDNVDEEEDPKDEKTDSKKEPTSDDKNKIFRDRQTGITVLMTISEERYFDYMEILRGLISK